MIHRLALVALVLLPASCSQPAVDTAQTAPAKKSGEKSVRPGVNKSFLARNMDVGKYKQRFETESREIFAHRHRIISKLELQPGLAVADIGAGTGVFLAPFAKSVGPEGRVFAVDIAPKFVTALRQRVTAKKLTQVEVVHCTERSTELPADSVDVAFVCDTYHHFEFPKSTLASLHRAIRAGGRLVIVDFERIPGVSRKWVLGHVRCGKAQVIHEIQAAGFRYEGEIKVKGLRENYLIRFRRD